MGYNRILPRVGGEGGDFEDKAYRFSANAINARSAMQPGSKTKIKAPGKTVGGAMSAAMGGGFAGAGLASLTGATAGKAATTGALGLGLKAATGWGALAMGLAYFLS